MPNDVAVMVSGGIDSYIAYKKAKELFDKVVPIFISLNQPYLDKELSAANILFGKDLIIVDAELCVDKLDNIPTIMQQEIYGRNLLIAFYGATLAKRVWIAALETEMNVTAVRDKQPEFFHMCSALFTYTFKSKRFETVVETPFYEDTKSDIIEYALTRGWVTKKQLKETTSCYDGSTHNCGKCSTCFKRWVAMFNNKIDEHYDHNPVFENNYAQAVIGEMLDVVNLGKPNPRYSRKRISETFSALLPFIESLEEDFSLDKMTFNRNYSEEHLLKVLKKGIKLA